MRNISSKYYIKNFKLDFANQGRVSKSFDTVLKNAPRTRYEYLTLRKVNVECEVVLNGETGIPLCRLSFPKQMGKMITNKEIGLDIDEISKLTDSIVVNFMRSRFPNLKECSYQLQVNN